VWSSSGTAASRVSVYTGPGQSPLRLRPWPDPAYFDDRATFLSIYFADVYRELFKRLKPGDTVVDCGANIGCFTVAAAKLVGPGGVVFAIEPQADNLKILRENIERCAPSNVIVIPSALSAEAGQLVSIVGDGAFARIGPGGALVSTTSLGRLVGEFQLRQISALKVDIEGSEWPVLSSASSVPALQITKSVQVEATDPKILSEMSKLLNHHGFTKQIVRREVSLLPRAFTAVLKSPKTLPDLYERNLGAVVRRAVSGIISNLDPSKRVGLGFTSHMLFGTRPNAAFLTGPAFDFAPDLGI
jgi:FkbM family methyltransferase